MKQFIFTAALFCCISFLSCNNKKVYVCNEDDGIYHLFECCEDLDCCLGTVKKVTFNQARKDGRSQCSECYNSFYLEYSKQ